MENRVLKNDSIFCQDQTTKDLQAALVEASGGEDMSTEIASSLVDHVEHHSGAELDENEVKTALREGQFVVAALAYRSVLNPHSTIVGFEGLARRYNPEKRCIEGAQSFAATASRYDMWGPIGKTIIEQSIRVAGKIPGMQVSLNLSDTMMLRGKSFVREVTDLLQEYDVKPEHVTFEVLEKTPEITSEMAATLDLLHEQGIKLALDDYGEGYSEKLLHQMRTHRLPLKTLKLASHITASAANGRTAIRRCLEKGCQHGIQTFIPEGSLNEPITQKTLSGLRELAEEWKNVEILVEGPVVK